MVKDMYSNESPHYMPSGGDVGGRQIETIKNTN